MNDKKFEWEDPAQWRAPKYDAHGKPIVFILHGVDQAVPDDEEGVINFTNIHRTVHYYATCETCGERYEISNMAHRCFNGKGDIIDAVARDVDQPALPAETESEE